MSKRGNSPMEKLFWDKVGDGTLPHPDTYTLEELNYLNPTVPRWFNEQHVAKRHERRHKQK